jgi:lysophospholipase L1-like esterase
MRARSKLVWSAAALLAGLALAEAVARFAVAEEPGQPRIEGEVVVRSDDPELRFENRPGAEQCIVYPGAPGSPERRVVAHVNAQGRRGRLAAPAPAPGVLRIAAVGDSHTFGHGVADDEAWPAVLERELAAAGRPVEVLNCGVNGYDAEQVFASLAKRVQPCAPDLVVYGFFCNDVAVAGLAPVSRAALDPLPAESSAGTGILGRLRAHSRLVDLVAMTFERRARWTRWADAQAQLYDEHSEGWPRLRAALRRARERTEAGGARFVVLLYPLLVPARTGLISTPAHRKLSEFCASEGIPCLDLEPFFAGLDLDALRVHPLDMHAGPEAHRIVGAALARWLRETGRI